MFQWSITLSDRQVMMLAAFNSAEVDNHGSQFHAVNAMVGDAWDVRAVRKLEEMSLISVIPFEHPDTGMKTNRWTITDKGRHIASAMFCDADALKQISLRNGLAQRQLINQDDNLKLDEKTRARQVAKFEERGYGQLPGYHKKVDQGPVLVGDQFWNNRTERFEPVIPEMIGDPVAEYSCIARKRGH